MLTWLAIAVGLLAWGAHGAVPAALAAGSPQAQRAWRWAALPAALTASVLAILSQGSNPDAALAAGFGPALPSTWPARAAAVLLVLALLGDAALLLRAPRTALDWRLAAGLGLGGALGAALVGELLVLGSEPALAQAAAGALCRLAIALGAGEAFAPGRPRLGVVAALGFVVYLALLPPSFIHALLSSRDALTVVAAAVLFAAARWLPARLRRAALVAAALLAALTLARVQWLATVAATETPYTLFLE